MMSKGFITEATLYENENDKAVRLSIVDAEADINDEGDETIIEGHVVEVEIGELTLSFNYDEAKALVEAFDEILKRY